jgi:predicted PurR-regulated permease PerM
MKRISIPDWFFFVLLTILTLTFYKILLPYILDILLAIILAYLMRGVFAFLSHKLHNVKLAAAITVFLTVFLIIIPILVVGLILANELVKIYSVVIGYIPNIQHLINELSQVTFLQKILEGQSQVEFMNEIPRLIRGSALFMVNFASQVVISLGVNLFHLFIICFLIYFLYIDGLKLLKKIMYLSPLDDKEEQLLIDEIINITDATLLGTLFVGVIEGFYGAIVFYFLGIPSPVFWGVVIMILSVIPIVGAIFIMVPAGLFLLISGSWTSGMVLIVLAYVGTAITQSYIKPRFVSRRAGPHPALIFLSTLGGLAWFGPIGFIVGPVLTSLFIAIWTQFGNKYNKELESWNNAKKIGDETELNDVY